MLKRKTVRSMHATGRDTYDDILLTRYSPRHAKRDKSWHDGFEPQCLHLVFISPGVYTTKRPILIVEELCVALSSQVSITSDGPYRRGYPEIIVERD
jgi:hypothetical protein